ncbi:MAG: bactofilin family protein [Pseudomonadales bacterium]
MFDKTAQNDDQTNPAPVSSFDQPSQTTAAAVIGQSIRIKGAVTGEENLVINGKVEGTVVLNNHDLYVGQAGQIAADMTANEVRIDGEVQGDITGVEKVVVSKHGRVHGNIVAPRVTLEDGAKFKGSIDMDPSEKSGKAKATDSDDQAESVKQALREVRQKSAAGSSSAAKAAKA